MAENSSLTKSILFAIFTLLLGLSIGIIIGYFVMQGGGLSKRQKKMFDLLTQDSWHSKPELIKKIVDSIDIHHIRDNLKEFSREPHVAGTPRDEELAKLLKKMWLDYGMDHVELVPYYVLLSHPQQDTPNKIEILDSQDEIAITLIPQEKPLRKGDRSNQYTQGYHAYSPKGIVEGNLVYANYGSRDDFETLIELNVSLKDSILLIKDAVGHVADAFLEKGVIGVLSFPSSMRNDYKGFAPESVYPNSILLPGTAIINHPIIADPSAHGDQLTPNYPALEDVYRVPLKNISLPIQILSQPISNVDAMKLLHLLDGPELPAAWNDSDIAANFRIGPEFKDSAFQKVRLSVFNEMNVTKIYNVIASLKGEVEPDRYVIFGNHRDAWGYGAVDPSSGTAVMMEIARVFGELKKDGWRPRRTMVFASWSAEEFGLIGSTEWVEEKLPKLHDRAVAYINNDICAMGKNFHPFVAGGLENVLRHVTTKIPDPYGIKNNLYDAWLEQSRNDAKDSDLREPRIGANVPFNSDYAPFYLNAVVPFVDINWRVREQLDEIYPAYHTGYDTFYLIEKFFDPTFALHRSCGHIGALLMHYLADSALLPYNLTVPIMSGLFERINSTADDSENSAKADRQSEEFPVDVIFKEHDKLMQTIRNWKENLKTLDLNNPYVLRMVNDQMMRFERAGTFLPHKAKFPYLSSRSTVLTSLLDIAMASFSVGRSNETNFELLETLAQSLSDFKIALHQMGQILQPFHVP